MPEKTIKEQQGFGIIIAYPFVILLMSIALNWFVLGVKLPIVALPSLEYIYALVIAVTLLIINHTWLMTTTELIRARFKIYATPEEWDASGFKQEEVSEEGLREIKRRHNAHRNTTENVAYFIFLVFILALVSPVTLAAQVWIIGFAVARLGYTYGYLSGSDTIRGLFMSLGLLSLYGIASYLLISIVI